MSRAMVRVKRALSGFTIMEVMVASMVSVIIVGGATVALIEGMQVWQQEQIKNELNLDLEISMEYLRQDLRLSSVGIGLMAFYTTNGMDYNAISMPLSEDSDNDGFLDRGADGHLIWNKTVVYHVRPGTPDQLLRTVFDNRLTNGVAADFYGQLNAVVASTSMADLAGCVLPGETVSSRVIFENLVDLRFTPPDIYFDGYWPTTSHAGTYNWGSLVLGPGNHELEFTVEGKNDLSSGYRLEIDKVALSASSSDREGEIFLPANAHPVAPFYAASVTGGSAVAVERGSGWSWSGNAALSVASFSTGTTFKLNVYNDLWCDTNFRDPGPTMVSNCNNFVDTSFQAADPFIWDVVVAPDKGIAWTASQCADASDTYQVIAPTVITNFIYGGTNVPSMTINRSGCWARMNFQRGENASLMISNVVIADLTLGVSTTVTFNGGANFVYMDVDGPAVTNSDWVPNVEIDKGHNLMCSFETYEVAGDRDLDLFFGGNGGQDIKFYENTGTQYAPAFPAAEGNWQGINETPPTAPAFGDLDNDGDMDMVIGLQGGTPRFKFYENQGTVKTPNMVEISQADIPTFGNLPITSGNPTPVLVDLNGDGLLDFVSGFQNGQFPYCQNTGTVTNPQWAPFVELRDSTNGLMDVGDLLDNNDYASPEFADIDGDGDYDLFSGGDDGFIRFWENIGDAQNPSWSFVTNIYGGLINTSTRLIVRFADMNADGLLDLYVGNLLGQLWTYENTGTVNNAMWAPPVIQGGIVAGRCAPALCNIDADRNAAARWTNGEVAVMGSVNGVVTNALIGLTSFEVGYARESVYRSGIFDTGLSAPGYNNLNWTHYEDKVNGWDVDLRIRSSSQRKMLDLMDIDWQDASAGDGGYMDNNINNSLSTLPHKRYVQYEARFKCNENFTNPEQHTNDMPGAKLRDVTIDWPGPVGLCDLLVSFGRGPDCGVVNVKVDGQEFIKGVQVDMTIFKEGRTGLHSANGVLEVRPLNTGK